VAAGSDPNWLLIGFFVLAVVLAYVAGRATGPVMEFVADWRQRNGADSQVIGRQALQDLRRLLPDLQRSGETSGDPEAHARYLEIDSEVTQARKRIASRPLRDQIEGYQKDVRNLAEFHRAEAARPPLLNEEGDVSGPHALGRVFEALEARQDAWQGLSEALNAVSEELRRTSE
jgi:hypothetical protein